MITLIAAVDNNNAIGYDNQLLCRLKDDMRHFVDKTKNKPVIMGATTFASLGYKPLKNRFNIVLTKSPLALTIEHADLIEKHENLVFEDLEYIHFMIEQAKDKEFMVIGGQQTYELFLPHASRIYLTCIYNEFEKVDTFFPSCDVREWDLKDSKFFAQDENNDYSFSILTLERKGV